MEMETDSPEPPDERKIALESQIQECEKTLKLMEQPGYQRLQDHFVNLSKPYEPLLKGVNTDKDIRDRAAFALYVLDPVVNAKVLFEKRLKDLKARLELLSRDKKEEPGTVGERLLQFFR